MSTTTIRLQALGPLGIEGVDPSLLRRRKPMALLLFLAGASEAGAFHQRDSLAALFWPDSPQARARGSLRQALSQLDAALQGVVERRGTEEVRLTAGRVVTDVDAFEKAVRRGDWVEAIVLYRGPFLDGVHLPGGGRLERWIDAEQLRLADLYRRALRAYEGSVASSAITDSTVWPDLTAVAPHDAAAAATVAQLVGRGAGTEPNPIESRLEPVGARRSWGEARGMGVLAAGAAVVIGILGVSSGPTPVSDPAADALRIAVPTFQGLGGEGSAGALAAAALIAAEEIGGVQGATVVPFHALPTVDVGDAGVLSASWAEWLTAQDVDLLVLGSADLTGTPPSIVLDLHDVRSGALVGPSIRVSEAEDPGHVARVAASRIATRIADRHARPATQRGDYQGTANPPSLAAYQELALAIAAFGRGSAGDALQHARLALDHDSAFVSAKLEVAVQLANLGDLQGAERVVTDIQKKRSRLQPWDRARLDFMEAALRGDQPARIEAAGAPFMTAFQLGYELSNVGRLTESLEALDDEARQHREMAWRRTWLRSVNLHRLRRHEEELLLARTIGLNGGPGSTQSVRFEARALAAVGALALLDSLFRASGESYDKPFLQARVAAEAAGELRAHGWPEHAARWYDRAIVEFGSGPLDAGLAAERARVLAAAGRWGLARPAIEALPDTAMREPERAATLAIISARTGDVDAARAGLERLRDGPRANAGVRAVWRARIHAALGDGHSASEELRAAVLLGAARPGWSHTHPEWRFLDDPSILEWWHDVS